MSHFIGGAEEDHFSLRGLGDGSSYEFPAHEPKCDCGIADGSRLELFRDNVGNLDGGSEV